ncbi:MAG: cupin domain-containing protein [Hyphomicrobiales bacterium]|nr:cupin domain-containing protein [Hyphomicrobiales bacterium]MDE2017011.1 cupin domain-containing protein [Hyphomicrobiales bacterium]
MLTTDAKLCRKLAAGAPFVGKQGFTYMPAISAETAGASAIHLQLLTVPPGARAKAHKHAAHETAIYTLTGRVGLWWGERLENYMETAAGDFVYIPADMPHLPVNLSATEAATAVIARTDPNEQESVVLLPELEKLVGAPPAAA